MLSHAINSIIILLSVLAARAIGIPRPDNSTAALSAALSVAPSASASESDYSSAPAPAETSQSSAADQTCQSFGIDYLDGGAYFVVATADPFTFVSTFQGCRADSANNLLVDPSGKEIMCTNTSLVPDNVNQLSTCPILKDQMSSGAWSVLLISNNGDGAPIAYERDFILTIGTQSTYTSTPTVMITVTTSGISTTTLITTDLNAAPVTTTEFALESQSQSGAVDAITTTVTPTVTIVQTDTAAQAGKIKRIVRIAVAEVSRTASCNVPARQVAPDPDAIFTPTLVPAVAMQTDSAAVTTRQFQKRGGYKILHGLDENVPVNRDENLVKRRSRLASLQPWQTDVLRKRAAESAHVVMTETDTALIPVSTHFVYLSSSVVTEMSTVVRTNTFTQSAMSDAANPQAPTVTVTAPAMTITNAATFTAPVPTVQQTETYHKTLTFERVQRLSDARAECRAKGGKMM